MSISTVFKPSSNILFQKKSTLTFPLMLLLLIVLDQIEMVSSANFCKLTADCKKYVAYNTCCDGIC